MYRNVGFDRHHSPCEGPSSYGPQPSVLRLQASGVSLWAIEIGIYPSSITMFEVFASNPYYLLFLELLPYTLPK